jgi:hypothetical protein
MKNPFRLPRPRNSFDTMAAALKESLKQPYIGVTQGGSSRKNGGARVAATKAEVKQSNPNRR